MTYYKVTGADGESIHGGRGKWSLPTDKPGRWRSVKGDLVACENGLHLVDAANLPQWLALDAVVSEAEYQGDLLDRGDKVVVRKARLTRVVGTLTRELLVTFACDCAERTLPIFEKRYPNDDRPRKAIETTRAWLRGEATSEQVRAAAYAADAAAAAAAAAADAAAAAAAAYAYAAYAASAAAYAASAARQKEREWQGAHLLGLLDR